MRWARASAPCISHDTDVYRRKFESKGWATEVVDGHDMAAVVAALDHAARHEAASPTPSSRARKKGTASASWPTKTAGTARRSRPSNSKRRWPRWAAPVPPIVKDDGHSYARKSLPVPPDFPAPPAPAYRFGQMVATREAYGTGLKNLGGRKSEGLCRGWRREEFHVLGNTAEGLSRQACRRATSPSKTW